MRQRKQIFKILILIILAIFLVGPYPVEAETKDSFPSYLSNQNPPEDEEPKLEEFWLKSESPESESQRKSLPKAILLSLLVPGGGEFYVGSKTRGRIFLGVEASLWASFFGFRTYGTWIKNDYRTYAAAHAGVNLEGKSEDFFEDINFYVSRDEYNQLARLYQREAAAVYPENSFWNWQWESPESQRYYRKLRNRSESAYRKALFMLGLSAANRVLSVIDTIREVRKYNRKVDMEFSSVTVDLKINPFGRDPSFGMVLHRSF